MKKLLGFEVLYMPHKYWSIENIEINQQVLNKIFTYNKTTGVLKRRIQIGKCKAGEEAGTKKSGKYILVHLNGKRYRAHNIIWMYVNGVWPSGEIDHIDGDTRNNKLKNLRDVTRQVNSQNKRKANKNNSTGFLGVCYDGANGKYIAQITVNRKNIKLGRYSTAEEAHAVYLAEKRKRHTGCTI